MPHSHKSEDVIRKKTCLMCKKSFKTNEHLRQHMRSHTGEKPYLCVSCGKAFSQQGNLIKHMRIHAGSRMFLCEVCSGPFMTKGALNEHLRVHRNEKIFKCEICEKCFRHKHGLVNHQRNRKYPCNIRKYGENKCPTKTKITNYINRKMDKKNEDTSDSNELASLCDSTISTSTAIESDVLSGTQANSGTNVAASYGYNSVSDKSRSDVNNTLNNEDNNKKRIQNSVEEVCPHLLINSFDGQKYNGQIYKLFDDREITKCNDFPDKSVISSESYQHDRKDTITESHQRCVTRDKTIKTDRILIQQYPNKMIPEQTGEKDQKSVEHNKQDICSSTVNHQHPFLERSVIKQEVNNSNRGDIEGSSYTQKAKKQSVVQNSDFPNASFRSVDTSVTMHSFECLTQNEMEFSKNSAYSGRYDQEPENKVLDRQAVCKRGKQFKSNNEGAGGSITEESSNETQSDIELESAGFSSDCLNDHPKNVKMDMVRSIGAFVCIKDNNNVCSSSPLSSEVHIETALVPDSKSKALKQMAKFKEEDVLKIIDKAQQKDFRCEYCNRKFANEYCLSVHVCSSKGCISVDNRSNPTQRRKHCDKCSKSYGNKYLFAKHSCKPSRQKENLKLKCKVFKEKKGGIASNKNVTVAERKSRNTNFIKKNLSQESILTKKKVFPTKFKLQRDKIKDMVSSKMDEKMICEVCGKAYKNKINLKNHSCKPTPEETRTCKVCGKLFNLKVHLQIHMRIHTGELPFLCKICGKRFNQGANLMKHMRIHNPEKLFKCEICERQFTQKGALTEHRIVHTNIKPYVCSKCDKSFRHKHGLQNHLKRKFPCNMKRKCEAGYADKIVNKEATDYEKHMSKRTENNLTEQEAQRTTCNRESNCSQGNATPERQFCNVESNSPEIQPSSDGINSQVNKVVIESESFEKTASMGNQTVQLERCNEVIRNHCLKDNAKNNLAPLTEHTSDKEGNKDGENYEIFMHHSQTRFVTSYGLPRGWVTLNCKLAEL